MGTTPSARRPHALLREGIILGAVLSAAIWVWIAVVDVVAGEPFRTFAVLGGVVRFTIIHSLLCLAYGVVAVAVVHAAAREPSLIVGAALAFFLVELGFIMLSAILSHLGLGRLAWVRILGGNVIGAVVTIVILWRRHPLRREFREASAEEEE